MNKTDTTINEDLMRHMILNTIRSYKSKFGQEYGRIVICADSKHYWRKDVFAYYKAHRKADREKSKINWNLIFTILDKIKSELKEYFPYQVIEVYGTEADDVIAVASKHFTSEKVLIVSNDKDLISLLNTHVSVYRPLTEELYCYKSESKIKGLLIR